MVLFGLHLSLSILNSTGYDYSGQLIPVRGSVFMISVLVLRLCLDIWLTDWLIFAEYPAN